MLPGPRFLILLLTLALPFCVYAQKPKKKKIEYSANSSEIDKSIGNGVKRLIGNVRFKHENVVMYCDSAYLFDNNTLIAYKNVHIQQGDSIHVYGDVLKYNGNSKKAEIVKNIRMTDGDMTLTTDQLNYDLNTNIAQYSGSGKIVNKDNVLTSQYGYYYSKSKLLHFKKNVILTNPEYVMNCDTLKYHTQSRVAYFAGPTYIRSNKDLIYCEDGYYDTENDLSRFSKRSYIISGNQMLKGDSLFYDRKKGYGMAKSNVTVIDSAERLTIVGQRAEYYQKREISIITGNPMLTQVNDKDTLFLHSDTLKASYELKDSAGKKHIDYNKRILVCYRHVKFFQPDLQGKCDSLAYTYSDSTMRLFGLPVLWSDNQQITAGQINILISNGEIKTMDMLQSAFIIGAEDSIRFNQIKGRNMKAYFVKNELYKIKVEGNGQTIYYAKNKGKIFGVNKAECSDILIYMKNNDISRITFIQKPEATLTPPKDVNDKELRLKGFQWRGNERPKTKKDIFK